MPVICRAPVPSRAMASCVVPLPVALCRQSRMTTLYYTVDTEYEPAFTARNGPDSRRENFERSILGRTPAGDAGIVYQMDKLDRHGLKGVFFVCPLPALLWGTAAIEDIVAPIVDR